jgi:hypothetical protein
MPPSLGVRAEFLKRLKKWKSVMDDTGASKVAAWKSSLSAIWGSYSMFGGEAVSVSAAGAETAFAAGGGGCALLLVALIALVVGGLLLFNIAINSAGRSALNPQVPVITNTPNSADYGGGTRKSFGALQNLPSRALQK